MRSKVVPAEQVYELVAVGTLSLHPRNANQGDIGAICESIEENGFYGACIVQKSTRFILAGNYRYRAALAEGLEEIPVIWVDVDDVRALKIVLADNEIRNKASYDFDMLAEILVDLAESSELAGTGFDGDDIDDLLESLNPKEDPSKNREIDPATLISSSGCKCPRCGFEFEKE